MVLMSQVNTGCDAKFDNFQTDHIEFSALQNKTSQNIKIILKLLVYRKYIIIVNNYLHILVLTVHTCSSLSMVEILVSVAKFVSISN